MQILMTCSCKYSDELWGYIKDQKFLHPLHNYEFLNKTSVSQLAFITLLLPK